MSDEEIDWSTAQACYGPATSVPAFLRQLASPLPRERSDAISEHWGCLCHQGTVYEASAIAVPFLFDAAKTLELPRADRDQLLALIVHIGLGEDTTWQGYTPWAVVQDCALAVKALLPDFAAWAPEGAPEARTWTLAWPRNTRTLGLRSELMRRNSCRTSSQPQRTSFAMLFQGPSPRRHSLTRVLASDADLRDYYDEVISELPQYRRARLLVLELAITERL